jgi:hypothetical protein
LHEAHRGVIPLPGKKFLAFSNDGYNKDYRAKQEVDRLREHLNGKMQRDAGTSFSGGPTAE